MFCFGFRMSSAMIAMFCVMCFPKVGDQESNVDRVNAPSELVDHPIL